MATLHHWFSGLARKRARFLKYSVKRAFLLGDIGDSLDRLKSPLLRRNGALRPHPELHGILGYVEILLAEGFDSPVSEFRPCPLDVVAGSPLST